MAINQSSSQFSQRNELSCVHKVTGGKNVNSKRLIVCCDGTWNNSNELGSPQTNVSRISAAITHKCCSGKLQIVYYHPGAGTEQSRTARLLGGFYGTGVIQDISECYRFICDNYSPGDEIILIGFSRGAFTARSVADMVCKLGILNRVGLQKFPEIFHDYRTWQDWKSTTFDEKKHLAAFTPENLEAYEKMCNDERTDNAGDLRVARVAKEKNKLFKALSDENLEASEKVKAYRKLLCEFGMVLTVSEVVEGKRVWAPVEGKVRAVGIWDTVGSLGMPRMPFIHYQSSRSDDEARFASCNVDPNIDYAFHALALDEWRTSFGPTLWYLGEDNNNTQLRQVWFPGNHGNVGGGWPDEQIATITLAWMADQLTSLGVEFSKPQMKRIFYSVNSATEVREWGKGKIYNPKGPTTWPDKLYNLIPFTAIPPRKPGMYTAHENTKLMPHQPMEFVHPSVRIRYGNRGKGLDDVGPWTCRALTENGYSLRERNVPNVTRPSRQSCATLPLKSLLGDITPYYESSDKYDIDQGVPLVRTHHPYKGELKALGEPKSHYVWQTEDDQYQLLEEYVGVWERMFMKINEESLHKQENARKELGQDVNSIRCRLDMMDIHTWLDADSTKNHL